MKIKHLPLLLLRLSMGWLFFYAGITKIGNSSWSAAGYLKHAKTFSVFFQWLAAPKNIGWVNFLNEWGLALIGISLIFGAFVRWSSLGGAFLMLLYYFPILNFPYPGTHSYLIDEHIIYLLVFAVLFACRAGRFWGLDALFYKKRK